MNGNSHNTQTWYMTDDEIRRSWRCAESKARQIKVLAELNARTTEEIKKKLQEIGIDVAGATRKRKRFSVEDDRRIWKLRHDENRTFKKIAQIIGSTTGETIRNRYGELLEEHNGARGIIENALRAYIKAGKTTKEETRLIDELIRRGI